MDQSTWVRRVTLCALVIATAAAPCVSSAESSPGAKTYKAAAENKLSKEEIRKVYFGRTQSGIDPSTGQQWRTKTDEQGDVQWTMGDARDKVKTWFEGDAICFKWATFQGGFSYCAHSVYRNPGGTREGLDEYLEVSGALGTFPFALVE